MAITIYSTMCGFRRRSQWCINYENPPGSEEDMADIRKTSIFDENLMRALSSANSSKVNLSPKQYAARPRLLGEKLESCENKFGAGIAAMSRLHVMSMLLQEAFRHAPSATFTLEATTSRSRDVYKHYAFEVIEEVVVGKGKVDPLGVTASGDAATGFPIYPTIRVP
ncbi:hypothetical protein B0H12DRAFT_1224347 [Mycena haematopus]|nr:hypothetical protein B0H12DRAFT_1224347 [Mycena haematopus]